MAIRALFLAFLLLCQRALAQDGSSTTDSGSVGMLFCSPCPGGDVLSDADACREAAKRAELFKHGSELCHNYQLLNFQSGCCAYDEFPENHCTLCPDGSADFAADRSIPGVAEPIACGELESSYAYYADVRGGDRAGTCDGTLLRASAAFCGCPGVEVECNLCGPDGEAPTKPERRDPITDSFLCGFYQYFFTIFDEEQCSSLPESLGINLQTYCGCPGTDVDEESDSDGPCDLCPEGFAIDASIREPFVDDLTCGELKISAHHFPADTCGRAEKILESANVTRACCRQISNDEITIRIGGEPEETPPTEDIAASPPVVAASSARRIAVRAIAIAAFLWTL